MGYVTRESATIPPLAERDEPSEVFGGTLCLRELTRAQYRAVLAAARLSGDADNLDGEVFNTRLFAAGVVDPASKQPLWTHDEIFAWPRRKALWDEIVRIADCVYQLSEVAPGALKSGGAEPDH